MKNFLLFAAALIFITNSFASLKIGTFNIRNYDLDQRSNTHTNKKLLVQVLKKLDYDFFSVQEIRKKQDFIQLIKKNLPNYDVALSECGGAHGQKLGFVYDKRRFKVLRFYEEMAIATTNPNVDPVCNSGSRPGFVAQFLDRDNNKTFLAIALHLKAGGSKRSLEKRYYQFGTLSRLVAKLGNKYGPIMLIGDLNTTEYKKGNSSSYYQRFQQFLNKTGMENLTSDVGCSSYWWGGRNDGKEYPSQLDQILVQKDFVKTYGSYQSYTTAHCSTVRCQVSPKSKLGKIYAEVSDHCPLVSQF